MVVDIVDNKVIEPGESYTLNGRRIATINPTILMNAESIDCPSEILAELKMASALELKIYIVQRIHLKSDVYKEKCVSTPI